MAKDTAADKKKRVRILVQKINEQAKRKVISYASEVPNPYFMRYPTGCMQLDIDMGGGFPAGGMTTISGPDGAGKTMLMFMAMAFHQRIFGEHSAIAMACLEFLPDYFFMRSCGVKVAIPDEMIDKKQEMLEERGMPLLTKEELRDLKAQTGEFLIIRGNTGDEVLNGVLDLVSTKEFGIIGVDGINSFMTQAEANAEGIGDTVQQSGQASLLTRFCHAYHPMTMGIDGLNPTALICTGQVRANRDRAMAPGPMQKYIKQWTETFPWHLRHSRLLGLLLWRGAKIREKKGENKGEQLGSTMNWETVKGKAGTHDGIQGETDFTYESLLDGPHTVVQAGFKYGTIKETHGVISVIRGDSILEDGIAGIDRFIERMGEDLEFDLAVRREILAAAGKTCTYR